MKIWDGGGSAVMFPDKDIRFREPRSFSGLAGQDLCSAPNHPPSRSRHSPGVRSHALLPSQSQPSNLPRVTLVFNKSQGIHSGKGGRVERLRSVTPRTFTIIIDLTH